MAWGGARDNAGKKPTYYLGKADYRLSVPSEIADEVEAYAKELDRRKYDEKVKGENTSTN